MINEVFYNPGNRVSMYLKGRIQHYPARDKSIITETYDYRVKEGEDIYRIAGKIFGENLQHYWTYILECNSVRHPDDIKTGDVLKIPRVIIRDSSTNQFINRYI